MSDALPSLEQFPVGGHLSVRGYRENQIVRDQGVVASLELRVPVRLFEERFGRLSLAPFADYGHATNRRNPTPDPENLGSVGIGLRWALGPAEAQLYWGHQLVGVDDSGNLQDDGVQFRVWPEPVRFDGLEQLECKVFHVYDPRITCIDDTYYITVALDTDQGCRVGLAQTADFEKYTFLGLPYDSDARNAV